jgi:hypothetical protein
MGEKETLIQRRQALKEQIQQKQFKSLAGVLLEGTERVVRFVTRTRRPISLWYSWAVFTLLTWVITSLVAIPLSQTRTFESGLIFAGITIIPLASVSIFGAQIVHKTLMRVLLHQVIDAIRTEDDVTGLESWLHKTFAIKTQLLFCLPLTLLTSLGFILLWNLVRGTADWGIFVLILMACFQGVTGIYASVVAMNLPNQVSYYELNLYAADPGSSELIQRLAGTVNSLMFSIAAGLGLLTFWMSAFNLLSEGIGVFALIIVFSIITAVFVNGHYALAHIIAKAKWGKLNALQAKIDTLESEADLTDKETMEAINRLIDYHDRIKSTPNSAVDLRAGLSFLNSALLPVLGFLLANLSDVIAFFIRIFSAP